MSGWVSCGVDVGSGMGAAVSPEGWVSVFVLTSPVSGDGSTGGSRVCMVRGVSTATSTVV